MSKTRSPRTGAAAESAASVTSAISWSMRVCSVTQRRVASLFQNVRCAIATVSVSLMTRCPSVYGTVNDRPQMASAERVAVMSERAASGRHGGGRSPQCRLVGHSVPDLDDCVEVAIQRDPYAVWDDHGVMRMACTKALFPGDQILLLSLAP
jgi:hypothetical protein